VRSLLDLKEREAAMYSPAISTGEPQTQVAMPGRRWIDRMLGSDPGLNRLRSAALAVITIGLILAAEALFVRLAHALQVPVGAALPAAEAARAASADHEGLVVMMLIGALVGLNSLFGVNDPRARGQLVTMLLLPVPLVAALALGLSLGSHRLLCLILLPVIMAVGTYLRRFGPRGMFAGSLLFFGFFFGFFLHAAVTVHDLGWLTAAIGVGLAVAIAVRFLLFFPNQKKALLRTERSFTARARKVISSVLDLFDDAGRDPRSARRLQTQLLRLNEAALMFDAQLGDPDAVDGGSSRQQLHQRLFDFELALASAARFAEALARMQLSEAQRNEIRLALLDVVESNPAGARRHAEFLGGLLDRDDATKSDPDGTRAVLLHRFAGSMAALADAGMEWLSTGTPASGADEFQPAVTLFAGWLPGSAGVSAMASAESGDRPWDRVVLRPWTRTAIQMGVAAGVAVALGDLVSPSRYYWAVIAVFVTFMGANNSGEQTARAFYRIVGTVIGIAAGSLLVDLAGHHNDWSIAVVLVSIFFGFYLMRINNTFFVIAITVMFSQLYQELYEFSYSLLLYRLAETALGAALTIAVVTLVFPLRTRRVLRVAFRSHIRAIETLVDHAGEMLTTTALAPAPGQDRLRHDARAVDASYQALVTTAQPLRRNLFGTLDEGIAEAVRLASATRNFSQALVADLASAAPLGPGFQDEIGRALATFHRSMDTVADAMTGPRQGVYVRSSSLYDRAERSHSGSAAGTDQEHLPIQDLKLIDGAMAGLARSMRLEVTDFDTVRATT
jgi:uncharacterized membrane protein YccC